MSKEGGVAGNGWIGGVGTSASDAMWTSMWSGRGTGVPAGKITEGPLAEFPDGFDPVEYQRSLRHDNDIPSTEKTARVVGNDNNFDGATSPGGNRVVQQNTGAGSKAEVHQTPDSARAPAGDPGTKKDSAPSKGTKGGDLMRRIKAKSGTGDSKPETATQSVGTDGQAQGAGHNLSVKEPAPVPKEMDPRRRVGNLADNHGRSAWTGSGPQAALHNDREKVGELVTGLLSVAGVPPRPLPETSLLHRAAANVARSELSKTASVEYLSRSDTHPLKIMAELTDALGEEWTGWEPETIRETLEKEAGAEVGDDTMNKIMAVKIVMAAPDRFYDDWQAMEKISVALNDVSPTHGTVEDVPVEWLSNAVAVVEKISGYGDFSSEVSKYVAARLFDQGYVVAPPKLAFADPGLGDLVGNDDLRRKVILAYAKAINDEDAPAAEDPVSVQVARLMRNHIYVLDKLDESVEQLS